MDCSINYRSIVPFVIYSLSNIILFNFQGRACSSRNYHLPQGILVGLDPAARRWILHLDSFLLQVVSWSLVGCDLWMKPELALEMEMVLV